ncbi:MAG TPA: hypothetical protein DCZ13_02980 [Porticoccaceae bacterium]|nr:hypothetical protein [Porticoccaceae bacterium]
MSPTRLEHRQLHAHLTQLRPGTAAAYEFTLVQSYLPGKPSLSLLVLAAADAFAPGCRKLVIVEATAANLLALGASLPTPEDFETLSHRWQSPVIDLQSPLGLTPVCIGKPWGQEIWFTGIEERGLSGVTDGRFTVPLAWVVAVVPVPLMTGQPGNPNLLKILDPLPEPVYGDLYFELHEEKREVYVVTHVDSHAWPDGRGAIRFGFDPRARARYAGDDVFRQGYLQAVTEYREIRRQIDSLIDQLRERQGIPQNAPVSSEQSKLWMASVPARLRDVESKSREVMNQFTQLLPLAVGDVVQVPPLLPHSLQHGVRTVEFQSPVYERKILSFAQKVLTQTEWDTREAVELMTLDAPQPSALTTIEACAESGIVRERIADFDDFRVERLQLGPDAQWTKAREGTYALAMVVSGQICFNGIEIKPENAAFIPAACGDLNIENKANQAGAILLCRPRATK